MSRVLVGIPTLNEVSNVEPMVERLLKVPLSFDVLFVDDNSDDGTREVLNRIAAQYSSIKVIHRLSKLGIGSAHKDILRFAYEHGYEALVTLDCDFSHQPEDIPRLFSQSVDIPLVVGSRFLDSQSLSEWNVKRKFLTHLGHWLTSRLLHLPMDATGAFRLYRLNLIPREIWRRVESDGYAFFFESLVVARRSGLTCGEISIHLPKRVYGESKLNLQQALSSLKVLFQLYLCPRPFKGASNDASGWDHYWKAGESRGRHWYATLASIYRKYFIVDRLCRVLRKHFQEGDELYHIGCGSGEVDALVARFFRVVGVDISSEARRLYQRNYPKSEIHSEDILKRSLAPRLAGVYSLGLVEHFSKSEIVAILKNMRASIVSTGRVVLFWPHRRAPSVFILRLAKILRGFFGRNEALHPPEPSLLSSRREAENIARSAGLDVIAYDYGLSDLWIQAAIVLQPGGMGVPESDNSRSEKQVASQIDFSR
jgi:dolichol-phosphate mannosyltransferase